jgi:hypothetical protein
MKHDRTADDVRFIYEIAADDTRFMKQQQWKVVYYVLTIQGAVILYASALRDSVNYPCVSAAENLSLSFLAWAAAASGIWYISQSRVTLNRYRGWVKEFVDYEYKGKIGCQHKISYSVANVVWEKTDASEWKDWFLLGLFATSMAIGFTLVTYLLWRSPLSFMVSAYLDVAFIAYTLPRNL